MNAELELFVKHLRRQRLVLWLLAGLLVALGLPLLVLGLDRLHAEDRLAALLMGGVLGGCGLIVGLIARRFPPARNPGIRLLADTPERVIWIWPTQKLVNDKHARTQYALCTAEGAKPALWVEARQETAADALLKRTCPQALFGYESEWEAAFLADPRALLSSRRGG
jgi:hypothetical protein